MDSAELRFGQPLLRSQVTPGQLPAVALQPGARRDEEAAADLGGLHGVS